MGYPPRTAGRKNEFCDFEHDSGEMFTNPNGNAAKQNNVKRIKHEVKSASVDELITMLINVRGGQAEARQAIIQALAAKGPCALQTLEDVLSSCASTSIQAAVASLLGRIGAKASKAQQMSAANALHMALANTVSFEVAETIEKALDRLEPVP